MKKMRIVETELDFVIRKTLGTVTTMREIGLLRERYHLLYMTGRVIEG